MARGATCHVAREVVSILVRHYFQSFREKDVSSHLSAERHVVGDIYTDHLLFSGSYLEILH